MSASGGAFRVNDILVMIIAFVLAESSFVPTFLRPTSDLLLKVCKPTLVMPTAMGLRPFSILCWTNSMNLVWSIAGTSSDSNFKLIDLSLVYCNTVWSSLFNTLRPRQNGRHFADDIFKCIFLNENVWIPIKISLKFVPECPNNNIPALVQIMAWRRPGDKPLSEPMMVSLTTHICVTRPQWVKVVNYSSLFY